jgi:hypothetical protein
MKLRVDLIPIMGLSTTKVALFHFHSQILNNRKTQLSGAGLFEESSQAAKEFDRTVAAKELQQAWMPSSHGSHSRTFNFQLLALSKSRSSQHVCSMRVATVCRRWQQFDS